MEKLQIRQRWRRHPWQKMWKTMRIFAVCMCLFSFGLSAETLAQTEKVQLNVKNVTLETIFNEIQRQTDLAFLFNHELVADLGTLSLKVKDRSVEEVLNDIFQGTNLTWSLNGNMIVVKERQLQQQSQPEECGGGVFPDPAGRKLYLGVLHDGDENAGVYREGREALAYCDGRRCKTDRRGGGDGLPDHFQGAGDGRLRHYRHEGAGAKTDCKPFHGIERLGTGFGGNKQLGGRGHAFCDSW